MLLFSNSYNLPSQSAIQRLSIYTGNFMNSEITVESGTQLKTVHICSVDKSFDFSLCTVLFRNSDCFSCWQNCQQNAVTENLCELTASSTVKELVVDLVILPRKKNFRSMAFCFMNCQNPNEGSFEWPEQTEFGAPLEIYISRQCLCLFFTQRQAVLSLTAQRSKC